MEDVSKAFSEGGRGGGKTFLKSICPIFHLKSLKVFDDYRNIWLNAESSNDKLH